MKVIHDGHTLVLVVVSICVVILGMARLLHSQEIANLYLAALAAATAKQGLAHIVDAKQNGNARKPVDSEGGKSV